MQVTIIVVSTQTSKTNGWISELEQDG